MEWAVGVTTVPERACISLPITLESLERGGFSSPRLFIDGAEDSSRYRHFGLETTCRWPKVRGFGNWWLGLWELYIRQPRANFYAMFQDDILCCRNVRQYLEKCQFPAKSYLNLILYPANYNKQNPRNTWVRATGNGLGAQGLVFTREGMLALIGAKNNNILHKPSHSNGHQNIDGAIVDTMFEAGWKEYVHAPSLICHIGEESAMNHPRQPDTAEFLGEDFDALSLLYPMANVAVG